MKEEVHQFFEDFKLLNHFKIISNNVEYTSGTINQLSDSIELELRQVKPRILVLKAEKNHIFISRLLAAFRLGIPVAILGKKSKVNIDLNLGSYSFFDNEMISHFSCNDRIELPEQTFLILFTSGTTSRPKAVCLSKENVLYNTCSVLNSIEFGDVNQQLLFLELSYSFGLLGQMIPSLAVGLDICFIDFLDLLKIEIPEKTMLSGVPSQLDFVLDSVGAGVSSLKNISHFVTAGSNLNQDQCARFKEYFSNGILYSNYGLTELSPRVLSMRSDDEAFLLGYTGRPVGDVEVDTFEDTDGNNLLKLKSKQIMLGYLDSDANSNIQIKNGWLYTNDIAEVNKEKNIVKILGRSDDVLKLNGEKLHPIEIENKIKDAFSGINCMIGLSDPHGDGEKITCFYEYDKELSLRELHLRIKETLETSLFPQVLQKIEKLPRTKNGKLKRKKCIN